MDLQEKRILANKLRQIALTLVYEAQSGHLGGSYSAAEILIELLFEQMRLDPQDPASLENDVLVVDKGHITPGYYAALHLRGVIPEELLHTYRRADLNSPPGKARALQGHPKYWPELGIWFSTGSLGMGISQAVGMAIAEKMRGRDTRIYVLLSDGGMQEGVVWEAARNAAYHKLDNLTAVLDLNWIQNDDFVFKETELLPVAAKWEAHGWAVIGEEVPYDQRTPDKLNGHDFEWLSRAFAEAKSVRGRPAIVIANTLKGKGIPDIEDDPAWHAKAPTPDQYERWMQLLRQEEAKLKAGEPV